MDSKTISLKRQPSSEKFTFCWTICSFRSSFHPFNCSRKRLRKNGKPFMIWWWSIFEFVRSSFCLFKTLIKHRTDWHHSSFKNAPCHDWLTWPIIHFPLDGMTAPCTDDADVAPYCKSWKSNGDCESDYDYMYQVRKSLNYGSFFYGSVIANTEIAVIRETTVRQSG